MKAAALRFLYGEMKMAQYVTLTHTFGPLFDAHSRILILGSFPSVKSREANFFYGHPQNRFWKVIAAVTDSPVPSTIDEKKALLHGSHIALWDTIRQCDIIGSSDSSIRNVIPNDLSVILDSAPIRRIYCNGAASANLFHKYQEKTLGRTAVRLPSTSPANAAFTLDRLVLEWSVIRQDLLISPDSCGHIPSHSDTSPDNPSHFPSQV